MTPDLNMTIFVLHAVTLAALYAFLLLVALLVWRDVKSQAPSVGASTARLVVLDGGDTHLTVGQSLPVFAVTTVGRSPECTVYLADASVSATHAMISWRAGRWWIEDQGSLNGTVLNETPIEKATLLSQGDVLSLGRIRLRFETTVPSEGR